MNDTSSALDSIYQRMRQIPVRFPPPGRLWIDTIGLRGRLMLITGLLLVAALGGMLLLWSAISRGEMCLGGVVLLGLLLATAFGLIYWVTYPLYCLVNAAVPLAQGAASADLPTKTSLPEVDMLIAVLNTLHHHANVPTEPRDYQWLADELQAAVAAREKAEKDNQDKLRFLSMVNHEFKNWLTVVETGLNAVFSKRTDAAPDAQRMIDDILAACQVLIDLSEQLVDVTQIEQRRLRVRPEPTTLTDIFGLLAIKLKATMLDTAHPLLYDLPDHEVGLTADPQRIAQVFYNLISNAVYYSPPSTTIRITVTQKPQHLLCEVRDRGAGVPAEEQPHLFRTFVRGDDADRLVNGLGLGLVICKGIVKAHGGNIWYANTPSTGSTFAFILPLHPVD